MMPASIEDGDLVPLREGGFDQISAQKDGTAEDQDFHDSASETETEMLNSYETTKTRHGVHIFHVCVFSARFGWTRWQLDFGWYVILLLEATGLAKSVKCSKGISA